MNIVKKVVLLLVIFIFASTTNAYCKVIKKDIEVQTKDLRVLKASVSYVKIDGLKKYPTVVLLHSLGYSSEDWGNLIPELNNAGYAVIAVDFRGHGKSIYNSSFQKRSWVYFKPKTYLRFPNDVMQILKQAQTDIKIVSLENMAIIGADIGANTAILVAKQLPQKQKPKTLVLISPTLSFKGLYIPLAMTDVQMPILSMVSKKDAYCIQEQKKMSKFSQGGFYAQNYPNGGMGMLMLKSNPSMSQDIVKWIIRYLK